MYDGEREVSVVYCGTITPNILAISETDFSDDFNYMDLHLIR